MRVKLFDFPTFYEWYPERMWEQQIGAYKASIRIVAWCAREPAYWMYGITISNKDYNGSEITYYRSATYTLDKSGYADIAKEEKELREWYELKTKSFNDEWKEFVEEKLSDLEEYFEED